MFRSTANFDKLLEKATSHLLLEPEWTCILQICDSIRQGDAQAKYAVSAIKKKLCAHNPHVAMFAFQVLESVVKNCGSPIHQEVASKAFMEDLRELLKATTHENVKNKILELIQAWAHAFRNEPNYRAVQDAVNLVKMEGYKFPAFKESDAMFLSDQAPEWADGDCCHRCRVQFNVVQRKHHCRNCGQIFCNRCSSRTSPIPRFGLEKEVRVCEACWEKLNKPSSSPSPKSTPEQNSTGSSNQTNSKSEQELQEEEELQLALALSKSESESKEKEKMKNPSSVSKSEQVINHSPPATSTVEPVDIKDNSQSYVDSELARYLNRPYWEQKQQEGVPNQTSTSPVPSAPIAISVSHTTPTKKITERYQNGEIDELEDFVTHLRSTIEIFVNRLNSNSSRGRPVSNDTYVQSLFMNITNMHSQLMKHMQEQDQLRAHFEGLQDKLAQVKDARAALDALREEHREKLRREAEEAERLRQIQMAQKLEIMRKQKQEYLQYQRQLAIQRMQEQEREIYIRQEQQKHQYQTPVPAGVPTGVYSPPPGAYMPHPQGFPVTQPSSSGSSPAHIAYQVPYGPNQMIPQGPQAYPSGDYQPYPMQGAQGAAYPHGQVPPAMMNPAVQPTGLTSPPRPAPNGQSVDNLPRPQEQPQQPPIEHHPQPVPPPVSQTAPEQSLISFD